MLDGFHQHRPVADQLMTAFGAGVVDRTWNRVHLASLFCGEPGGNQRTTGDTRLDHQHAEGQTADDPVSPGKVAGGGAGVQLELRKHRATRGNHGVRQPSVALWIKLFKTRAKHTYRLPANVQSRLVRRGVDAQGQTAGEDRKSVV